MTCTFICLCSMFSCLHAFLRCYCLFVCSVSFHVDTYVLIFVVQGSEQWGTGSADVVVADAVSRLGSTSLVLGPGLHKLSEGLFHLP